jgi:hypothetical protein
VIGEKVMATEKKDRPWDGKSRPVNDKYRDNYDSIFGKLQQEQRDLDESYRQSLKNKKERSDEK